MTDSFLKSMTFSRAGEFLDSCDCDECDNVPLPIRRLVHERKRQRLTAGIIKRTQQRTLVARRDRISLWCMHMPKSAEPLVEFGSSHRIVWIKHLRASHNATDNNDGILRWIGQGIIGSQDEEKSRKKLVEWTEGNVFLVPSNGGKAVGWIYARDGFRNTKTLTDRVEEQDNKGDSFAILYIAKIPMDVIDKAKQEPRENNHRWANQMVKCCQEGLALRGEKKKG
mmetsp:Transcript_25773/g.60426  ORF Transcript_25773/g.60426 Transcript_25773/m.60426 type:complete len:225 (+) Transcript_25773:145-819(+)